jgi:RimJ/RimL family protein N-acetyltransferase
VKRIELGLKLWSTDTRLAKEALILVRRGIYSYIELFAVPGSFEQTGGVWSALDAPFLIHAPHSLKGLNPAKREQAAANEALARESFRFADALDAKRVIFHPGVDGPLEESIRQLRSFGDTRILVENKPREGLDGTTCVGWSPEEMAAIKHATGYGFCLDFGHAWCAAVASGYEPSGFIASLRSLGPEMYHLTDGDAASTTDRHDRYGMGSLPLPSLLASLPDGARVTNEGGRALRDSLAEAEEDSAFLLALDELSRAFPSVEMKRARQGDVDAVFALSNDPSVRTVSFSSDPIPYERHVTWFDSQLRNPDGRFFVFYSGTEFAGQVRFQRESGTAFAVSVSVSAPFRGRGYAKAFMKAAMGALRGVRGAEQVLAYVKNDNEVSRRYFEALGFVDAAGVAGEEKSMSVYCFRLGRETAE